MDTDTPRVQAAKKAAQAAAAGVARAVRAGSEPVALAAARRKLAGAKAYRCVLEQMDSRNGMDAEDRRRIIVALEEG